MKGIGKANVGCISLVVASWWTMLHGLFLVWPLQESVKKIDQYLEKGNLALTHFLNSRHEVFGLCNATMFTPNSLTSNIERDMMHGSKACVGCMPPWVAQVLSLVVWGSQNSWFGLSCPAHCSSSLVLHLSIFISGFSCGALTALIALWTFGLLPLDFRDHHHPARRPSSLRLLSYLHERSAR